MTHFFTMGLVGLIAVLIGNGIALALGQTEAAFFSRGWWSAWFAHYLVWMVFLILGAAQRAKRTTPTG